MSKKKAKKAATKKKAAKKAPVKRAAKKTAKKKVRSMALAVQGSPSPGSGAERRCTTATIFVYDTKDGVRVRTSPQLLSCPPGDVEWTVVNLSSDAMPDVDITWHNDSPWGGAPINIKGGNKRMSFAGAKAGRFKYNVTCNGYTEDPEIEYPVN